jgi:uncharacterized membrane protein YhfC
MISNSVFFAFVFAAICTLLLPIALLVILGIKKKINGLPLLIGAIAFFLSQIVLRLPIISAFSGQGWYKSFAENYYIPFVLLLCLSAGLFEESARLGGALILKKHRTFKDAISFGLGHALCEVIALIGVSYINNIVLCMLINGTGGGLTAALPSDVLEAAAIQLAAVNPAHIYLGLLERFSTVIFHIFATVLVFRGIIEKKWYLYVLAIASHTVFNFIGVILANIAGIAITEIVVLGIALAAGYYTIKGKAKYGNLSRLPSVDTATKES